MLNNCNLHWTCWMCKDVMICYRLSLVGQISFSICWLMDWWLALEAAWRVGMLFIKLCDNGGSLSMNVGSLYRHREHSVLQAKFDDNSHQVLEVGKCSFALPNQRHIRQCKITSPWQCRSRDIHWIKDTVESGCSMGMCSQCSQQGVCLQSSTLLHRRHSCSHQCALNTWQGNCQWLPSLKNHLCKTPPPLPLHSTTFPIHCDCYYEDMIH